MKGDNSYIPTIGERVLVSAPNMDDENGYFYGEYNVLWMDEKFILYGDTGIWPNLDHRENVHIKELIK